MDILVQQRINGLIVGSIYALIALGYTMVYGIWGLINFAHGEIVMIGVMVTITCLNILVGHGVDLPGLALVAVSLLMAVPVCALLGYAVERVAYRPLRHAPRLAPLITAIGMSIVLQNLAMIIWGWQYVSFPAVLPMMPYQFFGASITTVQILIIVLVTVMMGALMLLVNRTRLGRAPCGRGCKVRRLLH